MRLFILLFILFSALNTQAKDHRIISQIKAQYEICGKDHFFSLRQINSKNNSQFYRNEILQFLPESRNSIKPELIKSLNLIPVNNCVLRGNRNYYLGQELLEELDVQTIITMDALVNKRHQRKHQELDLVYLPILPKKYPAGESLKSIVNVLDYLSQSNNNNRIYISCFFGKHRTGLVIGLYQFLRNYVENQNEACKDLGTLKDKAFNQMNAIADLGVLTYDMPSGYIKFYKDFGRSVCQGKSQEFLETN